VDGAGYGCGVFGVFADLGGWSLCRSSTRPLISTLDSPVPRVAHSPGNVTWGFSRFRDTWAACDQREQRSPLRSRCHPHSTRVRSMRRLMSPSIRSVDTLRRYAPSIRSVDTLRRYVGRRVRFMRIDHEISTSMSVQPASSVTNQTGDMGDTICVGACAGDEY
jgi:hypothetical protein